VASLLGSLLGDLGDRCAQTPDQERPTEVDESSSSCAARYGMKSIAPCIVTTSEPRSSHSQCTSSSNHWLVGKSLPIRSPVLAGQKYLELEPKIVCLHTKVLYRVRQPKKCYWLKGFPAAVRRSFKFCWKMVKMY
jgi:hypothetical protein